MKIKELTKEIMNIVVPEKEIKIVSPKAAKAFIKALMNSKKVSKFLSKLPDYIEASKANEEERIAMLAFAFGMDESQEKEFEKMQAIFKDKNPESQNTRKVIARIIMSPSYDLDKVLDKMNTSQDVVKNENKKGEKETMKNKKDKTKEEAKHNEKVKKDVEKEEVKEALLPIQETVLRAIALSASPRNIKELIDSPGLVKELFSKVISDELLDRLISEINIKDREKAVKALMGMVISGAALINKTKEFNTLEKWLTMVLNGKSFEEIMKAFNVKNKDLKLNDDEPELGKKFSLLVNKVTGASTSEEINQYLTESVNEFIEEDDELIERLEGVEKELKEESKANEKAANAVHAAVDTIKKVTLKPDPTTLYNESSNSLKAMVSNGSLTIGETYIVKVGDKKYTARLICLGGEHYSFELGAQVASL